MFPPYLQTPVAFVGFRQTFVVGAPWHKDELIRFWGQRLKVKVTRTVQDWTVRRHWLQAKTKCY